MTDAVAAAPEIRFDHVSKAFGRTGSGADAFLAVDDLCLDINTGEIAALLGKTGCGAARAQAKWCDADQGPYQILNL
jgi:ABC-type glutathione transport system ATPase component